MDIYGGLNPQAQELVRKHRSVINRLPRTFLVNTLVDLQKWPRMFEPERKYFRALFDQLSALDDSQFKQMFGDLGGFEEEVGCNRTEAGDPMTAQAKALNRLRKKGAYPEWRRKIDAINDRLEPMVEARLYSTSNLGPRLVVLIYGQGIAIARDTLWQRFAKIAVRVPLSLGSAQTTDPFLRELFTGRPAESDGKATGPTVFQLLSTWKGYTPLDNWIIEAGDGLHSLCEQSARNAPVSAGATGLSYERLRAYRERISNAIYSKVTSSRLTGPLELEAWLGTLEAKPQEGLSLYSEPVILDFVRDIFVLGGNGSLIINNSFVEWCSVQALRRAQPRVLVARFGVRDKLKPFSSLLLFSKPRPTDRIPIMEDPLGSFVDVELLSYYIWLKSSSSPPYQDKTLYLLLAEGVDEMAAILPGAREESSNSAPSQAATLPDVAATMAEWLGVKFETSPGRPISALLA